MGSTLAARFDARPNSQRRARWSNLSVHKMVRFLIAVAALPLTVCSFAQVRGIKDAAVTDVTAEIGVPHAKRSSIKNVSGLAIEAIHVTFLCTAADGRIQSDENGSIDKVLQYDTDHFIPAGGSYQAKVVEPGNCTARTDAVVYANGEVEGDPDKIDLIFQRRSGAYKALQDVIPMLDGIASGGLSPSDVIATLQNRIKALPNDHSLLPQEITGEGLVFSGTISLLKVRGWLRTPSDDTPNRQPRLAELMQAKGLSLEQAQAFVSANKYREWQAALRDSLAPRGQY